MTDDLVPTTRLEHVTPDIEGVADVLWLTKGLDPEMAWSYAVSGDTAARMTGTAHEEVFAGTAELLKRAAAYGWWPKRNHDGDYIAVPIQQWIAEGHPFTQTIPNAETMLDRWGIQPVVIDAAPSDHPADTP